MKRVLKFFNLLDYQNNLSLTNIIVIGCFIKCMIEPVPDLTSLSCLTVALLSYGHKRYVSDKRNTVNELTTNSLDDIKKKVDAVIERQDDLVTAYNANAVTVQKAIEDHTDLIGRVQMQVNGR